MAQIKFPRKVVSSVQLWASLLLIVMAFVFSMTPIITLNKSDNESDIEKMIADLGMDSDVKDAITDATEISSLKMIGSISLIIKIVGASTADDPAEKAEKTEALEEYLESEEGKEAVATAVCLAVAVVKTIDFENSSGIIGFLLNIVVSLIGLFTVLVLTLILPFIFGIMAIISIIQVLKNLKYPEVIAPKLAKKLPGMVSMPLILMLFQCVVPGMTYASGIVAIAVIAVVATLLNFIATRTRDYASNEFKYLNIVQGCSVVGIIGFVVFFFSIIETGIFKALIGGEFSSYIATCIATEASIGEYIVEAIMVVMYLVIVLSSTAYIETCTGRLSCAVKHGRFGAKAKGNAIVLAIFTAVVYVVPTYLDGSDKNLLTLTEEQSASLSTALIGIIIMIVAELAVIVLKMAICPEITAEQADVLLTGNAKTSDEKIAEAQQILANANMAPMMNPNMAPMNPNMAPMNPNMAPMNPNMAPMNPNMPPMDPNMAPMNPNMGPNDPNMGPQQ